MWRSIKGYEGLYDINDRAMVRRRPGFKADGRKVAGGPIAATRTSNGMRAVALWKDGKRRNYMLHKVYAAAFQISENEAARRIYHGFTGKTAAVQNVRHILLSNLKSCQEEQAEGLDRHDEILYFQQFLDELMSDTI